MTRLPPQMAQALAASDPPYIEAALDQATGEYGSLDAYLEKRLGVGPAQRKLLQDRYLQ
jgi:protein-tyrosine phosphatase